MDIAEQKAVLRAKMREARKRIPRDERDEAASLLAQRLLALSAVRNARIVGVYRAYGSELSLTPAIAGLKTLPQAPSVAYPLVRSENAMTFARLADDELALLENPKAVVAGVDPQQFVAASEIDVLLVPGIAFGEDRMRLGQGGGYYDRYMPKLRGDCITVGIAFEQQIAQDVPADEHDRRVDYIMTPERLIAP